MKCYSRAARVPREWHLNPIRPLTAQRYLSTVQVARIFRDGQPINAFAVSRSVTKQPTVPTSEKATTAEKITDTTGIVRMLSDVPIATPNTWLVHQNVH